MPDSLVICANTIGIRKTSFGSVTDSPKSSQMVPAKAVKWFKSKTMVMYTCIC